MYLIYKMLKFIIENRSFQNFKCILFYMNIIQVKSGSVFHNNTKDRNYNIVLLLTRSSICMSYSVTQLLS